MKISVRKSYNTKGAHSFSKVQKIFELLASSKIFDEEVKRLKNKYKIPIDGWPIDSQTDYLLLSDKLGEMPNLGFFEDCELLTQRLKLPSYWADSIFTLLTSNVFQPPSTSGFDVLATSKLGATDDPFDDDAWAMDLDSIKSHISNLVNEKAVLLAIRRKMSKTELLNLIEKHWDEIETGMQNLTDVRPHKMQRVKLAKEIAYLRITKKMKFSQIAETLAKQYENDQEIYDLLTEDYVKNLFTRWKQIVKNVSLQ